LDPIPGVLIGVGPMHGVLTDGMCGGGSIPWWKVYIYIFPVYRWAG